MDTLKERIKYYREKKNISKSELARQIGVSPAYITKLENGDKTNPSLEIILKITNTLDCAPIDIMPFEDFEKTFNTTLDESKKNNDIAAKILNEIPNTKILNENAIRKWLCDDIKILIDETLKATTNLLRYDRNDFSESEILEIGHFVYLAYNTKINEILSKHKDSENQDDEVIFKY